MSGCSSDFSSKTSGSLSSFSSIRLVSPVKNLSTLSFFWSTIALMSLLIVSLVFNASSWVISPFSIFSISLDALPKKIILLYPVGLACKLFLLALKTLFYLVKKKNYLLLPNMVSFYQTSKSILKWKNSIFKCFNDIIPVIIQFLCINFFFLEFILSGFFGLYFSRSFSCLSILLYWSFLASSNVILPS